MPTQVDGRKVSRETGGVGRGLEKPKGVWIDAGPVFWFQ